MIARPIYLDGFATQPLAPEARTAMLSAWDRPGNAGSPNAAGEQAAALVATGRAAVASLIGASPGEITFTSGATEANNLALAGVLRAVHRACHSRSRVIVSAVEHKSVLETADTLRSEGIEVIRCPVDKTGRLNVAAFAELADERLLLASIMLVNNETGAIQPIAEAAALAHRVGGLFHTDAAQAIGKSQSMSSSSTSTISASLVTSATDRWGSVRSTVLQARRRPTPSCMAVAKSADYARAPNP
ncbi:aminotransferase class V-fold PLP-dependent enzyme [Chenggangzhangella methanolivorans]|uniref:Aminotransferase class V-fold PLP-dependent enzyme n=1 Tax=Chenggangzhangella methanolivorans TaxID=1437009 RepID=A0A9E6R9G8_9HYPH|nr:aminotransferase class V-fold PLP-dependent enzyme [Chenggangzhangella methanolivorans]